MLYDVWDICDSSGQGMVGQGILPQGQTGTGTEFAVVGDEGR